MIDDYGNKLTQDPGHIQLRYSNNDYQYEEIMLYDSIHKNIVHQ